MSKVSEEELNIILDINTVLDKIPVIEQSKDYQKIVQMIHNYLNNNCKHNLVYDYIDIDLDRTKHICYCNKCFITFNKQ